MSGPPSTQWRNSCHPILCGLCVSAVSPMHLFPIISSERDYGAKTLIRQCSGTPLGYSLLLCPVLGFLKGSSSRHDS